MHNMPTPSHIPKFVYKILPEAPPSPLPANLLLSDLDAKDGFIHLSTAEQVPATAGRFFAATHTLWLLKIELDRIEANVRWEDAGESCFPHIYGPMPGNGEIVDVKDFRKGDGEDWAAVLEKEGWLA